MSGKLLDFSEYIGGPDSVITLEAFPRTQKTYTFSFGQNVSTWQFSADYQSILLSEVQYDRVTGNPVFTTTTVKGYFDNYSTISNTFINTASASSGTVYFTIPADRYTGDIYPNARTDVVATVVSFQWSQGSGESAIRECNRFLVLERWEAGVPMGDPTQETSPAYISL